MFINVNKLKGRIVESGLSIPDIAEKMGLNKATLYRKLENGGTRLTVRDANMLVEILGLDTDDAVAIFFAQSVA